MTCDTKRHWILSVVCRSSARFIMRVEIMNRGSKRIRKTILCVMKSIVKSYRQKGVRFLENESCDILLGNQQIHISGLELPLIVNEKNSARRMSPLKIYADAWEKSILQEIREKQQETAEKFRRQQLSHSACPQSILYGSL